MNRITKAGKIIEELRTRAKEINCLYNIEETLCDYSSSFDSIFSSVAEAIPGGWQYPEYCCASVAINGMEYKSPGFEESEWLQEAGIKHSGKKLGSIKVYYTRKFQDAGEGPFTKEERELINLIADKAAVYSVHRNLRSVFKTGITPSETNSPEKEWKTIIDLIRFTDRNLFMLMKKKMSNHLYRSGIIKTERPVKNNSVPKNENQGADETESGIFTTAAEHFGDEEILNKLDKWIQEDKASGLLSILEGAGSTLEDIAAALRRNAGFLSGESELAPELDKSIRVSLARKLLSDNLKFIDVAKKYITVSDFIELFDDLIYPRDSRGKTGGKGAGIFLAAKILKKEFPETFDKIKFPKTKFIASDGVMDFIHHNNLEEVFETKYRSAEIIEQEYPYVVSLFKNSGFSPEIRNSLSELLDEFGEVPLAVRSSALLEDDIGTDFSGQYKSLFVANQGDKEQRLKELTEAVAEVYASIFSPGPLKFRHERGLIDYNEQMGVIIQEIAGAKAGNYFLPSFSGAAYSTNVYKWADEIGTEDRLIKLCPGMGIKFSKEIEKIYPVLISGKHPSTRVYNEYEEIRRYSPGYVNVLNLKESRFETVSVSAILKECGNDFPGVENVITVYENGKILKSSMIDYTKGHSHATVYFDGLISGTEFVKNVVDVLGTLERCLGYPVEIEFSHDGKTPYLLQFRAQAVPESYLPSQIPQDIARDKIIFTSKRGVCNAKINDITHAVYIEPSVYFESGTAKIKHRVKEALSKLNGILPAGRFVLFAGGQWGCGNADKRGIDVDFSDISNAGALFEVIKKTDGKLNEPSFGRHLFAEIADRKIPCIPVFPDEKDAVFNEMFLGWSPNILTELIPGTEKLEDVIKVTDVISRSEGRILRILLNAETGESLGYLTFPEKLKA